MSEFHGSNADIKSASEISEEINQKLLQQDEILQEFNLLSQQIAQGEIELADLQQAAMDKIPNETDPRKISAFVKASTLKPAGVLRAAKSRRDFCRSALRVIENQVSGLQSKLSMLKTQMRMDGNAK